MRKEPVTKENKLGNPFEVLESMNEDKESPVVKPVSIQQENLPNPREEEADQQMEGTKEGEGEDMELGELDLDAIEEECRKKGQGYVSRRQLELLQEAII